MATALGLMIYCLVEIEQTNISDHKVLLSTSEVYSLSAIERRRSNNFSLFTHRVCIEMIDSTEFDYENVKISLEKQRCAHVSTKELMRIVNYSLQSSDEVNMILEFYWIRNTNFSFNINLTTSESLPETGNLTIYLLDDLNQLSKCNSGERLSDPLPMLVFSYSANSPNVNCTHVNDNLLNCETSQVVVNTTGRYYMCMVFSTGPQFPLTIHADYKLEINEVRYDVSDLKPSTCRLNESNCCSSPYGNLLKEAANPSCVFIRTESFGNDISAVPLSQSFKIFTQKKWDGLLYSIYLFLILLVFPTFALGLYCYTQYRKRHPGYCCQVGV